MQASTTNTTQFVTTSDKLILTMKNIVSMPELNVEYQLIDDDDVNDDAIYVTDTYTNETKKYTESEFKDKFLIASDSNQIGNIEFDNESITDTFANTLANASDNTIEQYVSKNVKAYSHSDSIGIVLPKSTKVPSYIKQLSSKIESLKFPILSTKMTIDKDAFNGLSRLTSIYLPSYVEDVSPDAFEGCRSLIDVYASDSICNKLAGHDLPFNINRYNEFPEMVDIDIEDTDYDDIVNKINANATYANTADLKERMAFSAYNENTYTIEKIETEIIKSDEKSICQMGQLDLEIHGLYDTYLSCQTDDPTYNLTSIVFKNVYWPDDPLDELNSINRYKQKDKPHTSNEFVTNSLEIDENLFESNQYYAFVYNTEFKLNRAVLDLMLSLMISLLVNDVLNLNGIVECSPIPGNSSFIVVYDQAKRPKFIKRDRYAYKDDCLMESKSLIINVSKLPDEISISIPNSTYYMVTYSINNDKGELKCRGQLFNTLEAAEAYERRIKEKHGDKIVNGPNVACRLSGLTVFNYKLNKDIRPLHLFDYVYDKFCNAKITVFGTLSADMVIHDHAIDHISSYNKVTSDDDSETDDYLSDSSQDEQDSTNINSDDYVFDYSYDSSPYPTNERYVTEWIYPNAEQVCHRKYYSEVELPDEPIIGTEEKHIEYAHGTKLILARFNVPTSNSPSHDHTKTYSSGRYIPIHEFREHISYAVKKLIYRLLYDKYKCSLTD